MPNERYIGDGVYASLDPARMIILRTNRGMTIGPSRDHWIALEPEVLCELIAYAYEIGWGEVVEDGARAAKGEPRRYQTIRRENWQEPAHGPVSDEEYTRDEEDKERIRASKEGFPDED